MKYSDLYVTRIRSLCRQHGITLYQLHELSGVSQSTLSNIMCGHSQNQKVLTLHKIALAFGMTLAEFLDFRDLNEYAFDDNEENFDF